MERQPKPAACDFSALPPGGRERIDHLVTTVLRTADDVRPRDDGLELGFSDPSPDVIAQLAEFVSLDRLCCPFMGHSLEHEPHDDRIWLKLTGAPDLVEMVATRRS